MQLFLDGIVSVPWDDAAADRYGLRAERGKVGTPIGSLDTMIAAHTLATGAILVTNDERLFRLVKDLTIINCSRSDIRS